MKKMNGRGRGREARIRGKRMERGKDIIKLNIIYINESLSCASTLKSRYTLSNPLKRKENK